ncbi:MAG: hypothetical protein ACP5N7_01535 [Candidatus Pacearchaeota archaeon]
MRYRDFRYEVQRESGLSVRGACDGLLRDAYDSTSHDTADQINNARLLGRLFRAFYQEGKKQEGREIMSLLREVLEGMVNKR